MAASAGSTNAEMTDSFFKKFLNFVIIHFYFYFIYFFFFEEFGFGKTLLIYFSALTGDGAAGSRAAVVD